MQNANGCNPVALLGPAHEMALMVQDLTNPMLAQIPHVLLAAHARTIMGVESNAMQFYPDASSYEAQDSSRRLHSARRNARSQDHHRPGFRLSLR